jgi:3-deoxy-D-manno-octulosonic-acid transferase
VGPYTFNFAESVRLALEAGAAIEVSDPDELGRVASGLLADRAQRERMGKAGLALLRAHQGATQRTLGLLRS